MTPGVPPLVEAGERAWLAIARLSRPMACPQRRLSREGSTCPLQRTGHALHTLSLSTITKMAPEPILLGKRSVMPVASSITSNAHRLAVFQDRLHNVCVPGRLHDALFTCTIDPPLSFRQFRRSWKFLVLVWGSSCVVTLPPFSIKALIIASLACCGFDRIGICLPYRRVIYILMVLH